MKIVEGEAGVQRSAEIIGKRFNKLVVKEHSHKDHIGNHWKCVCDCGNETVRSTGELNRNRGVKQCGDCVEYNRIDYKDKVYGYLKIGEYSHTIKGKSFWNCKCICGNEKIICSESFRRLLTISCGCLKKKNSFLNLEERRQYFYLNIEKKENECWEWIGLKYDYGRFTVGKEKAAHRASWILHNGQIPENLWVLHKCNNKLCVNPKHLYLGTVKENVRDSIEAGTFPRGPCKAKGQPGIRNCKSKLDEDKVRYIKFMYQNGFRKVSEMGDFFGVNRNQITHIGQGKMWSHVCV